MSLNKVLAAAVMALAASLPISAQVQNHALQFSSPRAVANLGVVSDLADSGSYTLQFWFNPEKWEQGASLVRCGKFSIKLGVDHALVINDGSNHLSLTAAAIGANRWSHLTLRCANGTTTATVNNSRTFSLAGPLLLPAGEKSLWLGGDFCGRIDEVRLWNGSLPEDYNSFWQNTLNELNPNWDSLAAYWKMDQEQCVSVVDYKGSHHGTLSPAGVAKTPVSDNDAFRYRVNLAYGNVQRFFDRKIDARHYSLSNRICILGASMNASTGAVTLYNPRYDASLGSASFVESYSGRQGVMDVSAGAVTLPAAVLSGGAAKFAAEAWVFVDSPADGAEIIAKGNSLKLTAAASGDLSLTLGARTVASGLAIPAGEWVHVGISSDGSNSVTLKAGTRSKVLSFSSAAIPAGSDAVTLGAGLKGKIDDAAFWNDARSVAEMNSDAVRLPLADADHAVAGNLVWKMVAAYDFRSAADAPADRFSVQNWFDIMRSYTEGMRGVDFIVTVNAERFDGCLSDVNKRNRAIADMIAIANDDAFDGIDLDFEWPENGWGNIATVMEGIRAGLKPGKLLSVSPHAVYYSYPVGRMDAVDAFNFQIYGPNNKNFFTREGYDNSARTFVNHGFPKDKIIMSYATTTTGGMNADGKRVSNSSPAFYPAGYRSIYKEGVTAPSDDRIFNEAENCYYFLTGFDQTVYRAQYVVDNNLGGIFYWDLGNDLPADHPASLARAASYAVNSNVEPLVTSVPSAAPAPEADSNGPEATPDPDDQGGFNPEDAREAISAALAAYSRVPGFSLPGSTQRAALLNAVNLAALGQTDGQSVTDAVSAYLAAPAAEIAGPVNGRKYYIIGVNSNDDTRRYLHIADSSVKATAKEPETKGEAYEWTAAVNSDGSFTLRNGLGQYLAPDAGTVNGINPPLTANAADAMAFTLTAGNALGRLQLMPGTGRYLESRYVTGDNPDNGIVALIGADANNDASNPKRWSSQWTLVEVEPELLVPFTVATAGSDLEGGIALSEFIHALEGDEIYVDPAAPGTLSAKQTEMTGASTALDSSARTITVNYSGLDTRKVYRLRNRRSENEYMTMGDNGLLSVQALDEANLSQVFSLVAAGNGKFAIRVQNTGLAATSDQGGTPLSTSANPAGYFVIERPEGSFAFDRALPGGGAWNAGSRAISCPSGQSNISPWGTGVDYSWWWAEEVTEITIPTPAAICLPFGVKTPDDAEIFIAAASAENVTLTRVDSETIPAHTPVVIMTAGNSALTLAPSPADAPADAFNGNELRGAYPGSPMADGGYGFDASAPAFVRGKATANNGAWIEAPAAAATSLPIVISETQVSISEINTPATDSRQIYDLLGRRLASPARGINILNGRKILVK